jgi:hypothetical protein
MCTGLFSFKLLLIEQLLAHSVEEYELEGVAGGEIGEGWVDGNMGDGS